MVGTNSVKLGRGVGCSLKSWDGQKAARTTPATPAAFEPQFKFLNKKPGKVGFRGKN